jgi:hypothetical protein
MPTRVYSVYYIGYLSLYIELVLCLLNDLVWLSNCNLYFIVLFT